MIKHIIRSLIRIVRRIILGPRLALLADLSQGEILNLVESAAAGNGIAPKIVVASGSKTEFSSAKEIDELKEICAQLSERVTFLERSIQ